MKKYPVMPTKKQMEIFRKYWILFKEIERDYYSQIRDLEIQLEEESKITEIQFFRSDDGYCGIGNAARTMPLIHEHDLEED